MGVPAGTEGSVMLTDWLVVYVLLPVAAASTYSDGAAAVSADHAGVPDTAGPPAFTAPGAGGGRGGPVPVRGMVTALVPVWLAVTVAVSLPVVWGVYVTVSVVDAPGASATGGLVRVA